MIQSNVKFLEDNRDCLTEIINAETATKANKIRADLYRIIKQEFLPGYSYADDCGPCLFNMTTLLYRLFDEWKSKQSIELILTGEEINPGDGGLKVKASFPSNKNHHRK